MVQKIKYIFFDVANTLLYKPNLFEIIKNCINESGYNYTIEQVMYKHKFLTEIYDFPDVTNEAFYLKFNLDLLYSLGINNNPKLAEKIYYLCKNLNWEKFEDTSCIENIKLDKGIISNWDKSLSNKVEHFFGNIFNIKIVSEIENDRKPSLSFYQKIIFNTGLNPNEILYIGDSIKLDYIPSKLLGINCLIIDRDNFFAEFCPDIINDLRDISTQIIKLNETI